MKFIKTKLSGLIIIEPKVFLDDRGYFYESYNKVVFNQNNIYSEFVQDNISKSKKDVVRGLHYQREPHAEVKLVRCLRGAIWDVVVDLRDKSKTFGKWFGTVLSDENRTMMYVPKGFAHGFISLKPNSEILYMVSSFYSSKSESTLIWSDKKVGIKWFIKPKVISSKDLSGISLDNTIPIKLKS